MTRKRPNYKQLAWAVITIMFMVSLVLSGITVVNYSEIVRAKIFTGFSVTASPVLHLDAYGEPDYLTLHLNFTVDNPSKKELRVWVFNFKAWVRDLPMESGTDNSRWNTDIPIYVNGTKLWYYPVVFRSFSFDRPQVIVGAGESITLYENVTINRTAYPGRLSDIRAISNYSDAGGQELTWEIFGSAVLFIRQVPSLSGPDKNANVIALSHGTDISTMFGGMY